MSSTSRSWLFAPIPPVPSIPSMQSFASRAPVSELSEGRHLAVDTSFSSQRSPIGVEDALTDDDEPDYWDSGWAQEGEKGRKGLDAVRSHCAQSTLQPETQIMSAREFTGLPAGRHARPEAMQGARLPQEREVQDLTFSHAEAGILSP